MKKFLFYICILTGILIFAVSANVKAQDNSQFSENANQTTDSSQTRPNLLRELDLSNDQLQQIRQLNQQKKPLMQAAQKRQQRANQQLDEAIYADNIDESLIQTRLREAQNAHAEVLKIRSNSETSVRKILTPEQLIKFRQIRQQFEMTKQNLQNRRQNVQNQAPLSTFQNRRIRRQRLKNLSNPNLPR